MNRFSRNFSDYFFAYSRQTYVTLVRISTLIPTLSHADLLQHYFSFTDMAQDVQELISALEHTFSPLLQLRKEAEAYLKSLERQEGIALIYLQVCDSNEVSLSVRQGASIAFKNYIRHNWRIVSDQPNVITDNDREQIKSVIVQLMLRTPDLIQKQLSDAISIIGLEDFPLKWPKLLQEMVQYFQTNDFHLINGVLQTADSLFKRYRHECKSVDLWKEIKLVLETLAQPLTDLFKNTMKLTREHSQNTEVLKILFSSVLLIIRVFHSLIFQELPDQFADDNLKPWMEYLHYILEMDTKFLEPKFDNEPGLPEDIKAEICLLMVLFAQKYDDDFLPYIQNFVRSVWTLLVTVDLNVKYDNLVAVGIDFLAHIAEKAGYKEFFESPEVLQNICEKVVVPNMQFRGADEELFENNPEEYLRRDLEGSDVGTRRHAACNLVQSLCRYFEAPVTNIFSGYISHLLEEYNKDPNTNWRAKDVVLYLITALATRSKTAKYGATKTSDLVNINEIFSIQCLPHLQDSDTAKQVVLRADCIHFLTTFRSILKKEVLLNAFPYLINHLRSPSYVVHTYAAHSIEKLLTLKLDGKHVLQASELKAHFRGLVTALFQVLHMECSNLNEYVMKAILRAMTSTKEEVMSIHKEILHELVQKLVIVCENPSRPHFNHYLFECICFIIQHNCNTNASLIEPIETAILPIVQTILSKDIAEFMPYAFQILSLLIEVRPPPISQTYMSIYPVLLTPMLWEQQGNIPALVQLLQAYIMKAPNDLCSGEHINSLLGVFQKLIASKTNDNEGFYLLNALIEHGNQQLLSAYWKDILVVLFKRLQSSKTTKYVKGLIVCLSLFSGKLGGSYLLEMIDSIQLELFAMLLEKVIIPDLQKVSGFVERKICAIGLVHILTETPQILNEPYQSFWVPLLNALINLFELPEDSSVPDEDQFIDVEDTPGYQAAFSQLAFATSKDKDPFAAEVQNPKIFLATSLHKLSQQHPGKFGPLIASGLDKSSIKSLEVYFQTANVAMLQ